MSDDPQIFLVPDYYPYFSCKMGACRHACCEGWPISLSLTDYFRLLSADCPPDMRRRLDCALRIVPHPTPDRYAQLEPRYDGSCAMHMPDGRCAIHAHLSPDMLAAVCRLYPRGVRTGHDPECSCANSCEATLELLLHRSEPLAFQSMTLCPNVPQTSLRSHHFYDAGQGQAIRLWLIAIMQDRRYPLPERLMRLGHALFAAEQALDRRDDAQIAALLGGTAGINAPRAASPCSSTEAQLQTALRMLQIIGGHSRSVQAHGETAVIWFSRGDPAEQYRKAVMHLNELLPDWEIWFEHMLVNHMFFAQFPFQDRPVSLRDEYIALCAVYVLLRCLLLGSAGMHPSEDALVDTAAAAFRLVEHTSFDMHAAAILKDAGCGTTEAIHELLHL